MTTPRLTCRARGEKTAPMEGLAHATRRVGRSAIAASAVLMGAMLSGCVSVNAPDKPIVIELNINIKQEVVYRLAPDAAATAKQNSGVF